MTDLSPRGVRLNALAQLMSHGRGCGCVGCGTRLPAPVAQAKAVAQLCPLCPDPLCLNGEKCRRKDKHATFAALQGPRSTREISQDEADLNDFIKQRLILVGLGQRRIPVPSTPEGSLENSPDNSPEQSPRNSPREEKKEEHK